MSKLILVRHGESVYNKQNIFTGWTDVELSQTGIKEAEKAGVLLKENSLYPEVAFTSWLKRAIHTTQIILKEMEWEHIDTYKSWKLNERHYGAWQGKDKDMIKKEVGDEVFLSIRRGYDTPPPPLEDEDKRLPEFDKKYKTIDKSILPRSESLKDTEKRVINYYYEKIVPFLAQNRTVLVSAHGNSLRSLVMRIEKMSQNEIVKFEIPTGEVIVYEFNETLDIIGKNTIGNKN
jgi:2,3-bisphosphoglycerate-dependent phosphoglycerate mutase